MIHSSIADLICVARRLGNLNDEVVFVGGCAVLFLVPAPLIPILRVTEDVDCVVQAATTAEYYRVSDRLRSLGFKECCDEGAPICRWVVDDIIVDVMPTGESALGFNNRWYDWVFVEPETVVAAPDLKIRVVNIPTFIATKFDAFADRGHGDYAGDSDFEDIVVVMAYREDAVEQVLQSPTEIRAYLRYRAQELLSLPGVDYIVGGCLPSDRLSQAAVPGVLDGLRRIAAD